jgi:hypothetical protein
MPENACLPKNSKRLNNNSTRLSTKLKPALLADSVAKPHNQELQFFLPGVWLEFLHCGDKFFFSPVFHREGQFLCKLLLAANRFRVNAIFFGRLPST